MDLPVRSDTNRQIQRRASRDTEDSCRKFTHIVIATAIYGVATAIYGVATAIYGVATAIDRKRNKSGTFCDKHKYVMDSPSQKRFCLWKGLVHLVGFCVQMGTVRHARRKLNMYTV